MACNSREENCAFSGQGGVGGKPLTLAFSLKFTMRGLSDIAWLSSILDLFILGLTTWTLAELSELKKKKNAASFTFLVSSFLIKFKRCEVLLTQVR